MRYPQPKHVHIYRLIAKNTSDVFLNNNSFGKEAIQQAFLGATPKMSECAPHHMLHSQLNATRILISAKPRSRGRRERGGNRCAVGGEGEEGE